MVATLALAPVFILSFYFYIRDKYEKEPVKYLTLGAGFGALTTAPIVKTARLAARLAPERGFFPRVFFDAFFISALVEETFKFVFLYFLYFKNDEFNEWFDGIVYAVFISLGFAAVENVLYASDPKLGGVVTAMWRAVFSVPGHAMFGVGMGYFMGLAKFSPRAGYLLLSFVSAWAFHGIYNLLISFNQAVFLTVFIPYFIALLIGSLDKMKKHSENSQFKKNRLK
jgi:RsiW-degrading membrane proteinase PrsW (M82 family)